MHLRLRICDGAHIATRPPGEQEDRLIPGPPWLSDATFTWLPERNSGQPLPAEQNARPAERRVCVVLLLVAFCEIFCY